MKYLDYKVCMISKLWKKNDKKYQYHSFSKRDERIQRSLYDYFKKNGIKNFVGVPDSTMKFFIDQGLSEKNVIITTREEEAIGIGTGFILSKSPTLIFMQNAGFGNSISTITSLVQLYNIPLIFLIGWRGYLKMMRLNI